MPVSIHDVAQLAGVSNATVSRVLAGKKHVSEETRRKVLDAVKQLEYAPNQTAQRLRSQQNSRIIGLVISNIQNPYFIPIVQGVEDAAYEHGMHIILCNTGRDTRKQGVYLNFMRAERTAGVIVVPTRASDGPELDEVRKSGTPVVLISHGVNRYNFDKVVSDERRSAYMAVRHFLDLGYRRIATITGAAIIMTGRELLAGYQDALDEAGIPADPQLICDGDFRYDTSARCMEALMRLPQPPEAVFVANNVMAVGALSAVRRMGVRVPEDVALISFGDTIWGEELWVPLTVVELQTRTIGTEAVRLLVRRLEDPDAPNVTVTLETKLVIRESCGAKLHQTSAATGKGE